MTSSTKQRKVTKTWTRAEDSLQRHPVPDYILEAEFSKLNTLIPTLYSTSNPTLPIEMEHQQRSWGYYTPRSPKYPEGSPQAEPEPEPVPELSKNEIDDLIRDYFPKPKTPTGPADHTPDDDLPVGISAATLEKALHHRKKTYFHPMPQHFRGTIQLSGWDTESWILHKIEVQEEAEWTETIEKFKFYLQAFFVFVFLWLLTDKFGQ